MKGYNRLIHALCSPELKPSQRCRMLLYGPETSALVTDWLSLSGVPDLVMLLLIFHIMLHHCRSTFQVSLFVTSAILPLLDGVQSSDSQAGKSHLSFVNKGKCLSLVWIRLMRISYFLSLFLVSWSLAVILSCRWKGGGRLWRPGQQANCPLPRQPAAFCWQPPAWHWWKWAQRFLHECVFL